MYLWVKALHVFAMVAWMSGLFYLPRLFVYHADSMDDPRGHARFCIMERRLFWAITTPSAVVTWWAGVWLAARSGAWHHAWLHAKLVGVLGLSVYHVVCGWYMLRFAADRNARSSRFFRCLNEVPTLLLAGIVILAVVQPPAVWRF